MDCSVIERPDHENKEPKDRLHIWVWKHSEHN